MSSFWSIFITVLTLGSIAAFVWILMANRKTDKKPGETLGHAYDGIEEYDNPLPAWWFWKFIILVIFSLGYMVYYPGLGNWEGIGGWTSANELEADQKAFDQKFAPYFATFKSIPVEQLKDNAEAMKIGQRLFSQNCAICHGSTASGYPGFPNLTDKVWLWGGKGSDIETTILNGRIAAMPAHENTYKEEQIWDLLSYVVSLNGVEQNANEVERGKALFNTTCMACHGMDGKGNVALGAPDLTNNNWLYGGSRAEIEKTIAKGRNGVMPAFKERLGEDKVHILAGYVYSLSNK